MEVEYSTGVVASELRGQSDIAERDDILLQDVMKSTPISRFPARTQFLAMTLALMTLLSLAATKITVRHVSTDSLSLGGRDCARRPQSLDDSCETPRFIFLGDSTMLRTAVAFQSQFLYNCQVIAWASQCDFPAFYGMPYDRKTFNDSIPDNYGPTGQRGCQDCSGCESRAFNCSEGILEFHGVEFAADYEYPTADYNLTQESVVLGYLLGRRTECDFVVFNTGLHDTSTIGTKPHIYKEQLEYYLNLLLRVYNRNEVLWVTTTHPASDSQPEKYRNVTSTSSVYALNEASRELMTEYNIDFLDVAKMSMLPKFKALITDGVHIGAPEDPWYQAVSFSIFERAASTVSKKRWANKHNSRQEY